MNGKLSTASIPLLIFSRHGSSTRSNWYLIELQKVYRQSDAVFVSVLDHIRSGAAGAADLQLLNTRYGAQIDASEEDLYITLATRRDTVETINERKLTNSLAIL